MRHVEQLIGDERLRIDTTLGRRPPALLLRHVNRNDRGVDLKRLMSEMNRPDRELQAKMPVGRTLDVGLSKKRWWGGKAPVGRLWVTCRSPWRALVGGQAAGPLTAAELSKALGEIPPPLRGVPSTVVLMSTSGFAADALDAVGRSSDRTVILIWPHDAGGWTAAGPPQTPFVGDLFDPEMDEQKRARIRAAIDASRLDLASDGVAAEKVAAATRLPLQLVETELKSYASQTAGLVAKRLGGRVVLFQEGSAPPDLSARGSVTMPFIERLKTLFARKGNVDKKIALLSERRADLGQQRDRGYEEMARLENKEANLRKQFAEASGELTRRRIASQLVQFRKDIARRQQLLSVLNQQINIVGTHLHTLELQQQGKAAKLPDSEEMAADAAAAEDVLAQLEADSELADTIGTGVAGASLSAEEQAVYDELMQNQAAPPASAPSPVAAQAPKTPQPQKEPQAPPTPKPQRGEAEPS